MLTTLHYADGLEHAARQRLPHGLRQGLQAAARRVRGAGLRRGADARASASQRPRATSRKKAEFAGAIEKAKIDSPRGAFTIGKSHNPVQDIYLRKVEGKENKMVNVAVKGLADPARGCRM